MLTLYRGHWILLLREELRWWCEITERSTAEILPTGASADPDEGPAVCLQRARDLIDRYVIHSPSEVRVAQIAADSVGADMAAPPMILVDTLRAA